MTPQREPGLGAAILLSLASCMPVMAILVIAPVLPQIEAAFADTPNVGVLVPVALTLPALMIAVFGWCAGAAVDRFGRRPMLIGALALYAVAGLAPLVLGSLAAIVAVRAVTGIAESVIITASLTLIGDYFSGRRRERYLSMQVAMSSVTAILFLAAGGLLGEHGWRAPFALYALAIVLIVLALPLLPEPSRGDRGPVAGTAGPATAFRPGRAFLICCGTALLSGIALYVPIVQNAFLLNAVGVTSPSSIGLVGSLGTAAILAGTLFYMAAARLRVAVLLAISFCCTAVGLVAMGRAEAPGPLVAGIVVASVGAGIFMPTLSNWGLSALSFEQRGRGMGLWQACFWLGQFVSPVVVIAATHALGRLGSAVIWIGAAFGLLAAVWVAASLLGSAEIAPAGDRADPLPRRPA